ncbi:MAG: hypothetical protein H0T65_21910, partial [Deltaproteobacteria bacterium]|nr:hypothetical protein [Deltaproteobacteria bacterium]
RNRDREAAVTHPIVADTAKPPIVKKPPKTNPRVEPVTPPRDVSVVEPPPVVPPAPPKVDNAGALAGLRTSYGSLDGELRRRELLESDVPAYVEAKREMAEALAASNAERAASELDKARAAIAAVTIDGPFVDKKVQRAGARIGKLPADRKADLSARLSEVLALYTSGEYVKANRKINEIVKLTATK